MPVFKNEGNGTWYVMARYVNWKGERKQKCKRGFATKKEAQECVTCMENSKLPRQRKNGNGREKSIWTDGECRRVSIGNYFLDDKNRSVARPCGWQTRRNLERRIMQ